MDRVDAVLRELRLPAVARAALAGLAVGGRARLALPPPDEVDALLARLGLAEPDRREMARARPDPRRHPALWWLLVQCRTQLVRRMGEVGPIPAWPALPPELGPVARYLYPWVFVATVPDVRRYHRRHGVPDDLSWDILAALGTQMAYHRSLHGEGGLHTQDWLTFHFRGAVYALGRLHVERQRIWFDAAEAFPAGNAVRATAPDRTVPRCGDAALGLHIPAGTLSPDSVDDALDLAHHFFSTHFPDERHRFATCVSWLLDDQLADYLPADSNIIRFQRRFRLLPSTGVDDNATMVEFVFNRPLSDLDGLPRDTTLQRAIVDHIRAGRVWTFRTGWFRW